MISAVNGIDTSYLPFKDPPNCGFNQFWDAGCFTCNSSCGTWPWCIRNTDCNICYNNLMPNCYGYGPNDTNISYSSYCKIFQCLECYTSTNCIKAIKDFFVVSYLEFGGEYYTYVTNELLISMEENSVSYMMQSGSNTSTDYFNNPDHDDYIPVACRGFYFNAGTFGQTRQLEVIPSSFTLYSWIKGYSGSAVSKGKKLQLQYDGSLSIQLSNLDLTVNTTYSFAGGLSSNWHYVIYNVSYFFYDTTITPYYDSICGTAITYNNSVFRDNWSYLVIGKNLTSNYTGFVMLVCFTNYQSSLSINSFSKFSSSGCGRMIECSLNQHPTSSCSNCSSSCTTGCYIQNSCGPCLDINCKECWSSIYCDICNANYTAYHGFCYSSRGSCSNNTLGFGCTDCAPGYYYLDGLCVPVCPTGYIPQSNNCTLSTALILSLKLYNIIELGTISAFNVGSNNSNTYPNYDSNDPWPAQGRGYYFNGSSSLNATGIIFNSNATLNLWVQVSSNGTIFYKGETSFNIYLAVYGKCIYANFSNLYYSGLYLDSCPNLNFSQWNYIEIELNYNSNSLMSTATMYINRILICSNSQLNFFFLDSNITIFYIGTSLQIANYNEGFKGFLLAFQAYNSNGYLGANYGNSTCIGGCLQCDLNLICPGNCSISYLGPNCLSCSNNNSNCSYSCSNNLTCNLCNDSLCYSCTSFSGVCVECTGNASLNTIELCQCNKGFADVNYTCQPCHYTCAECVGTSYLNCTVCNTGYLNFSDYSRCLPADACPNSFGNGTTCTYNHTSLVFNANFNVIQDPVYDSVGGLPIQSGLNFSFYPNYTSSDVWAAKGRGYYFTSTSYLTIDGCATSRLILAPEFGISLWIFISTDGLIFSRNVDTSYYIGLNASKSLLLYTFNVSGELNFTLNSTFSYNSWSLFEIVKSLNGDGEKLSLYINGNYTSSAYSYYYLDPINSVTTLLGNSASSFTGFLWSIQIYSQSTISNYSTDTGCIYPNYLTNCLPTCLIAQFFSASCANCSNCSNCSYSCGFTNSCNLCDDILCINCSNYSTCTACTSNALLNSTGLCQCNTSYTPINDTCQPCHSSCLECNGTSYLDCTVCNTGYLNFSDYHRCLPADACPNSFGNGTTCTYNGTSLVFNATFNVIQDIVYDSVGGLPIQSGLNSSFYPNYT